MSIEHCTPTNPEPPVTSRFKIEHIPYLIAALALLLAIGSYFSLTGFFGHFRITVMDHLSYAELMMHGANSAFTSLVLTYSLLISIGYGIFVHRKSKDNTNSWTVVLDFLLSALIVSGSWGVIFTEKLSTEALMWSLIILCGATFWFFLRNGELVRVLRKPEFFFLLISLFFVLSYITGKMRGESVVRSFNEKKGGWVIAGKHLGDTFDKNTRYPYVGKAGKYLFILGPPVQEDGLPSIIPVQIDKVPHLQYDYWKPTSPDPGKK